MKEEIFKPIEGYEELYEISSYGNVRSLGNGNSNCCKRKIMKPWINSGGYKQVDLVKDGIRKKYRVHRLVAQAFLPNPNNFQLVNHKDENPSNNCVDNLEWCTVKYNNNYGTRNDKIRQKMLDKKVKEYNGPKPIIQSIIGIFVKRWDSVREVERELGFTETSISKCANGKQKIAHGFNWDYIK